LNSASTERFIQALDGVHPEIAPSDVPPELKNTADGFFAPVAAVIPEDREQLLQIVRIAAEMRTPLVPVSSHPMLRQRTGYRCIRSKAPGKSITNEYSNFNANYGGNNSELG